MRARVEICDISDGTTQVVLESDIHVEAPNWAPTGDWLLVNAEGRLFRIPLDAPEMIPVDTGTCVTCNNDHGISPDGHSIVLSDKSHTDGSCVYILPVGGGQPKLVTDKVPSWWHGWSPDGRHLTYTIVRDHGFGIATCPAGAGDETILIEGGGHYDGPDYTPDGAWIWFNSDRGGQMNLWRIRPDGTGAEEMTNGASVDWFPHPSPDGAHVLYLAYPPGTKGHPFGRDVELRLMPADGGEPRTLIQLFDGQGTLNVSCWAPDSRRFAFVRYFETDQP